jgi:hypothetical protein
MIDGCIRLTLLRSSFFETVTMDFSIGEAYSRILVRRLSTD